jgi:hypothetical protein
MFLKLIINHFFVKIQGLDTVSLSVSPTVYEQLFALGFSLFYRNKIRRKAALKILVKLTADM